MPPRDLTGPSHAMRHRPIVGGLFGKAGRFLLASVPCVERGLHAVRYSVIDPQSGVVLSLSLIHI